MAEREPPTERINVHRMGHELGRLLGKVYRQESRVLVEKSGVPVAAIISARDLERLCALERERAEDFGALDGVGEAFADVDSEQVEREVARALARVREARRSRKEPDAAAS